VLDRAGLPMHQILRAYHFTAKSRTNGLMSQADAEQRNLPGKVANQIDADSRVLRSARTGRNQDAFRPHCLDFADADLVIATHLDLRAQFAEVLDEVVSERVVVVEDEDHALILADEKIGSWRPRLYERLT